MDEKPAKMQPGNPCGGQARFFQVVEQLSWRDYLTAVLAYLAAPTLYEQKPAFLVTMSSFGHDLKWLWERYGTSFCMRFEVLSKELNASEENTVVLLYKPDLLLQTLQRPPNHHFLTGMQYPLHVELEAYLAHLQTRYAQGCPYEIGVFLGIPVCDVKEFIQHGGNGCLFGRYWKVYRHPKAAKGLFEHYDQAKRSVITAVLQTKPGEKPPVCRIENLC